MRVLTHLGFGTLESPGLLSPLKVVLDTPFLGSKEQRLDRREVYPFSPWGVIRILNVGGVGIETNLQFFPGLPQPEAYLDRLQVPADETHLVFDLASGNGSVCESQPLGRLTPKYLFIRPWVDRWGRDRDPSFDSRAAFDTEADALSAFDEELEGFGGTGGGILAHVLYSIQEERIIRLALSIAPPQGIIYRWPRV